MLGFKSTLKIFESETFCVPHFKEWIHVAPPSVWLKLQAPVLKLPQNLFAPPPPLSIQLTLFQTSLFVELKLHFDPPPPLTSL